MCILAGKAIFELTYTVLGGMLNSSYSLTLKSSHEHDHRHEQPDAADNGLHVCELKQRSAVKALADQCTQ